MVIVIGVLGGIVEEPALLVLHMTVAPELVIGQLHPGGGATEVAVIPDGRSSVTVVGSATPRPHVVCPTFSTKRVTVAE
jgi:hypothetical protein